MSYPLNDGEFEETTITNVAAGSSDGWTITRSEGWAFWVPRINDSGVVPAEGQSARFYGRGIGSIVRGLFIDGKRVFYRTEAEQQAENERQNAVRDAEQRAKFERERESHDERIAALPEPFRKRITGFQGFGADWRWRFEGYELFTCEQAVAVADALESREEIARFHTLDYEQQRKRVPAISDDHSGNTFGAACRLAAIYLERPELIEKEHGALCPLVGCRDYGCWAVREEVA